MEEEAPNQKTKKINHSLNANDLNEKQQNGRRSAKSKNKKNASYPKPEGLKPKAIKLNKKPQIKKQKKSIIV